MNVSTINNTALVTGGSGGLGRVIVHELCKNGFRVIVNYLRTDTVTAELFHTLSGKIIPVKADVRKYRDVEKMAELASAQCGKIDVIINNAGITRDTLLIRQTEDEWDDVINTNLKGALNTIRAFQCLMKDGGHIVNISSYSGIMGREGQTAYSASKSAIIGLTKTAAAELAQYNIRVNAVVPGYMPAGMGEKAKGAMETAVKESLLHRLSDPVEVSKFIVFLVGTENITGQVFCIESRIVY